MTNVQAQKFQLIEWLIQLQDTAVLEQVKALKDENEFTPITSEELRERALASERDIAEGNVIPLREMNRQDLKEGISISEQQIKEGKYSTVEELAEKWNVELSHD